MSCSTGVDSKHKRLVLHVLGHDPLAAIVLPDVGLDLAGIRRPLNPLGLVTTTVTNSLSSSSLGELRFCLGSCDKESDAALELHGGSTRLELIGVLTLSTQTWGH